MQQNHVQHLPVKHVCRLSCLTSVPYRQFWSSKTIIIHYFHPTNIHLYSTAPLWHHVAQKARGLLAVGSHLMFTPGSLLLDIFTCPNKRNADSEFRNSEKRSVQHGQVGGRTSFVSSETEKYCTPSQPSTSLTVKSSSNQKSKKQMLTLESYRHTEMKLSLKANHS